MIYVAIGSTLAALGLYGMANQFRKGEAALLEAIIIGAVVFGIGLGLIGAGVS